MTFLDVPDLDEDWKQFLVNQPNLAPLHGGRVYFRAPTDTPANPLVYPFLRTYRAGGGWDVGEAPLLTVRFSVEVLHNQITGPAFLIVRQLTAILESVIGHLGSARSGNTVFLNGRVTSVVDKPDPDNGWPGRVVDALVTLRTSSTF